jgi:hypothetical protein
MMSMGIGRVALTPPGERDAAGSGCGERRYQRYVIFSVTTFAVYGR